jgi:bifunctional non-homologous end joining protein LigD
MSSPADSLAEYRRRRRFDVSPEPDSREPDSRETNGLRRFVIQRHRARREHDDLRLEHRGVLLSWAVPKGPPSVPGVRRLAVRTEDHPIDYAWFEGVIPEGYGAGDVIVWEQGWWRPGAGTPSNQASQVDEAIDGALDKGHLSLELHGEFVRGQFHLIHTNDDQWLLIRAGDQHGDQQLRLPTPLRSVLSGRTNSEVAEGLPACWPAPDTAELTALDELGPLGNWHLQGRSIALTNLDKILIGGRDGTGPVTKRDLIIHYATLAPTLAPYLAGRPVNLRRFPNGIEQNGFWQQAVPKGAPEWIRRWQRPRSSGAGTRDHLVFDGAASLAWAANTAAIEIHPWTSTAAAPQRPTYALIDIDPGPSTTWDQTLVLARLFRAALDHLDLIAGAKVTGQRGIQIWVPVNQPVTFDETRDFVERVSRAVGDTTPDLVSWKWNTADREGRARLDYTQNARSRTLVAPYSVRPAPGGPVSVPITWEELDDPDLRPDRWTVHDLPSRVAEVGDPFARILGVQQALPQL